ncbi:hypothetical protein M5C99_05760 [Acidovorax sp. NCPPB 2350]|nr:hypothetical protein M5C99_05760 [Acidovorax sp. NCPPB 2350]
MNARQGEEQLQNVEPWRLGFHARQDGCIACTTVDWLQEQLVHSTTAIY